MSTFTIEDEPVAPLDLDSIKSQKKQTSTKSTSKHRSHKSEHSDSTKKSKSKSKTKKPVQDEAAYEYSTPASYSHLIDIHDATLNASLNASLVRLQEQKLVRDWCCSNGFDSSIVEVLLEYSIDDLLNFEREDWKDLFGTKIGIQLHTRIKAFKHTHQQAIKHTQSKRIQQQCKYGICSISACDRGAMYVCSNEQCGVALCHAHAEKALLTSEMFCSRCLNETLEGKVACWMQSWQQTIKQSVEQSMEATQVLTGFNALPTLTQQGDDCTIM